MPKKKFKEERRIRVIEMEDLKLSKRNKNIKNRWINSKNEIKFYYTF